MTTVGVARDAFEVFGTMAVLLVTDPRAIGEARRIADRELALVDRACSRFREDSELMLLNAAAGVGPQTISPVFTDLLAAALRAARLTGGDVDPTCGRALTDLGYDRDFAQVRDAPPRLTGPVGPVPGWRRVHLDRAAHRVRLERGVQLDLGATAKAWASDRCAELIARRAGCGVLVSLGGDIAVAGIAPRGGWPVTAAEAPDRAGPSQLVRITGGAVATSSVTCRRWRRGGRALHHIVDPRTGLPADGPWRTASVAAATCADANAAAAAAIVAGERAEAWLTAAGLPARLVGHDGRIRRLGGWPVDAGQPLPTVAGSHVYAGGPR